MVVMSANDMTRYVAMRQIAAAIDAIDRAERTLGRHDPRVASRTFGPARVHLARVYADFEATCPEAWMEPEQ